MLSSEATAFRVCGCCDLKIYLWFSVNPVCWSKHCSKKLPNFHTAPGVSLDCISMLYFFVVSENVLCLSKLIYSDALMDSRRKWILQFCASCRVFLLRLIYQRVWTQLPVCSHSHLSRVPLSGCWCTDFLKIFVEKWGLKGRIRLIVLRQE